MDEEGFECVGMPRLRWLRHAAMPRNSALHPPQQCSSWASLCYHLLRRRACHRWLLRSERAPRASSFKLLVQLARHHGRPVQQSMVLEHHEYHKSTGRLLHRDNLRVQADLVSHPPVGQHAPRWAAARAAPPARDLAERCPRTLWTPLAPYSTGCASFCAWVGLGLGRPTGVPTLGST